MFAYCNNNPVNLADPTGTVCCALFDDNQLLNLILPGYSGSGRCSYARCVFSPPKSVVPPKEQLDTNDPEVVLENLEKYNKAYYHGVLVVKTPFDASFSLGIIGLSVYQQDENTLKHEYGHTKQLKEKGVRYISDVLIPSVTINLLDRLGKLPYSYYGAPWEAEADALGEAIRTYDNTPWPEGAYTSYWDLLKLFWEG